jgi:hypothetical protein
MVFNRLAQDQRTAKYRKERPTSTSATNLTSEELPLKGQLLDLAIDWDDITVAKEIVIKGSLKNVIVCSLLDSLAPSNQFA